MQQGDLCNVMGNVGSGADPAGVVFGVRIPLPFWGTPNFLKRGGGGELRVCARMYGVLVVNSNPDLSPPHFL